VIDRMSYIVLSSRCCDIGVLNVNEPSEGKCDNSKGSFYKELEQVLVHFPKYHMTIVL
jgi:hypothetical protein